MKDEHGFNREYFEKVLVNAKQRAARMECSHTIRFNLASTLGAFIHPIGYFANSAYKDLSQDIKHAYQVASLLVQVNIDGTWFVLKDTLGLLSKPPTEQKIPDSIYLWWQIADAEAATARDAIAATHRELRAMLGM